MYEHMTSNAQWAASYFDDFGEKEWTRLACTPGDRVSFHVHAHYLRHCIQPASRVLEIGAGPGKFTQVLADLGCQVRVSDVSEVQLELHKRYSQDLGFADAVESWQLLDVCDLSLLESDSFDAVVVYGGPLSYVFDDAAKALQECVRVCKPGGHVLTSVMSVWGTVHKTLKGVLAIPPASNHKITKSGNITPENYENIVHRCHMFRASELRELAESSGLEVAAMSASSCLATGHDEDVFNEADKAKAWQELLRMELEASAEPGCLDLGTHIILVGQKNHSIS